MEKVVPHFTINQNEDGSVAQILLDGEPYGKGIELEPPHQIVSIYFKLARANIDAMHACEDKNERRGLGIQAFVMSLTGIEAFVNVFFQLMARERGDQRLLKACSKQGPLVERLKDCLGLAFDAPLSCQEYLLKRIGELYRFRNEIVHPRWTPVSMAMSGLMIEDLCQNFQLACEDKAFCEQAFWQCISLIAEIGKANGSETIEAICFYWTGLYMLTEEELAERLKSPDGDETSV